MLASIRSYNLLLQCVASMFKVVSTLVPIMISCAFDF